MRLERVETWQAAARRSGAFRAKSWRDSAAVYRALAYALWAEEAGKKRKAKGLAESGDHTVSTEDAVRLYVASNPGSETYVVQNEVGAGKYQTRGALLRLARAGHVVRVDGLWYPAARRRLPPLSTSNPTPSDAPYAWSGVLGWVERNGPCRASEVAEALGMKRGLASTYLCALAGRGRLDRIARGLYDRRE